MISQDTTHLFIFQILCKLRSTDVRCIVADLFEMIVKPLK